MKTALQKITVILLLSLGVCALPTSALSAVMHYSAPLEASKWQLSKSARHCTLTHMVPDWGQVSISVKADQKVRIFWQPSARALPDASIAVTAPPWRDTDAPPSTTLMAQHQGGGFSVMGEDANTLLAALGAGQQILLKTQQSSVTASPVGFGLSRDAFTQCRANLSNRPSVSAARRPANRSATRTRPRPRPQAPARKELQMPKWTPKSSRQISFGDGQNAALDTQARKQMHALFADYLSAPASARIHVSGALNVARKEAIIAYYSEFGLNQGSLVLGGDGSGDHVTLSIKAQ